MNAVCMKIKEWFYDRLDSEASRYKMGGIAIDKDENHNIVIEDGCVYACECFILAETEKAYKVAFGNAESCKPFYSWVPKSVVLEIIR